jgi:hypothetical protein
VPKVTTCIINKYYLLIELLFFYWNTWIKYCIIESLYVLVWFIKYIYIYIYLILDRLVIEFHNLFWFIFLWGYFDLMIRIASFNILTSVKSNYFFKIFFLRS